MISRLVANHLGKPEGILGRFTAFVWNRRNAALNDTVFDLLALQPTDRVLEIGFGGGYLLGRMATAVTAGLLAGIDNSPTMVARGRRHYRRMIGAGRLELKCASAESLPYPDEHFTKVCSINSIFYWQDPQQGLREINRVLTKDGRFVLCFTDASSMKQKVFADGVKLFAAHEIAPMLAEVGFREIRPSSFSDKHRRYVGMLAAKPKLQTPRTRILILWEDDFDIHCMFSIFFEGYGHQVDIAKSFDDCFESCKSQPPTALMIHRCIHDPNDGLDFIRKIRSCSDIPYFPVIVGWADYPFKRGEKHRHYEVAFEAGANACFGAVFDITDVLRHVEMLAANPGAIGLIDR